MITRQQFEQEITRLAKTYADEAEHQDGDEYWEQFMDPRMAAIDFTLFLVSTYKDELDEMDLLE